MRVIKENEIGTTPSGNPQANYVPWLEFYSFTGVLQHPYKIPVSFTVLRVF
jgi:hypothetical protein